MPKRTTAQHVKYQENKKNYDIHRYVVLQNLRTLQYALALKWRWARHVARLQDHGLTKKVTEWKGPVGKRKKGRPYTQWKQENIKMAGPSWLTKSREDWQTLDEAFTC